MEISRRYTPINTAETGLLGPLALTSQTVRVHPLIVRVTHWINALAILVMVLSGWRIYNTSPLFDFKFPAA